MSGALDGVRILDLTRQMAGPYATALLSDHGADIVKVESVPAGDPSRWTGVNHNEGDSPLFLMWNRGKRSLALDLRAPEARPILDALVDWADVMIENFRPGVTARMGLDWERVSQRNPRLIYCSVTGFGRSGPLADRPATDPLVQAISGVMSVTGPAGGDPSLVGIPIADFTGAMQATQGILLALLARERTGRGQLVEVSLLAGLLSALSTRLATYWSTGATPGRHGNAHSVVVPYQLFATSDGMAMAGTWGPGDWPKFCQAIDRTDLTDDPRFATNEDRLRNRDALILAVSADFMSRSTAEWADRFLAAGALFAPLLTIPEALAHPQTQHLDLVVELPHRRLGPVPAIGSPIKLSDTEASVRRAPPVLGEHSLEVLDMLGFDRGAARALVERGVVIDGLANIPTEGDLR